MCSLLFFLKRYSCFTHVRHVLPSQLLLLHQRLQIIQRLLSHLHDLAARPLGQSVRQRLGHGVLAGGQQHDLVEQHRG